MASPRRLSESLRSPPTPGQEGWEVRAQPGWRAAAARLPAEVSPRHSRGAPSVEAEGTAWVLGAEDQNRPVFRLPPEVSALLATAAAAAAFRPSDDPPLLLSSAYPAGRLWGLTPSSWGALHFPQAPSPTTLLAWRRQSLLSPVTRLQHPAWNQPYRDAWHSPVQRPQPRLGGSPALITQPITTGS